MTDNFFLSSCLSFLLLHLSFPSSLCVYLFPFSYGETRAQRRVGPSCCTPYVHAPGTHCQSGVHPAAFSWTGPPIGQPSVQLPSRPGHGLWTWPATSAGPLPLPGLPFFPAPASPPGSQFAPPPCRLPHDVPPELCFCSSPTLLPAHSTQPQSRSQPVLQWPVQPSSSGLWEGAFSAERQCSITPNGHGDGVPLLPLLLTISSLLFKHQSHCWISPEPATPAHPLITTPPHTWGLSLLPKSHSGSFSHWPPPCRAAPLPATEGHGLPPSKSEVSLLPHTVQRPSSTDDPLSTLWAFLPSAPHAALPVSHLLLLPYFGWQSSGAPATAALSPGHKPSHGEPVSCSSRPSGSPCEPSGALPFRWGETEHQAGAGGQGAHLPLYRPTGHHAGWR